jgi:hypothetical protein
MCDYEEKNSYLTRVYGMLLADQSRPENMGAPNSKLFHNLY